MEECFRCYRCRTTFFAAENSEVFLEAVSVALAVMNCPWKIFWAGLKVKEALARMSVLTTFLPRKVLPWPLPEGDSSRLAKNWTRKVLLGTLLSLPLMVTAPDTVLAEVMTGKFCRVLAPVSASPVSLRVTPSLPKSIAIPTLEKMELERTRLPTPFPDTVTPAGLLKAMVLASPGAVPPTVLLDASPMYTPWPLPREPVPFLSVPMRLPSTLLLITVGPIRSVNGSSIETPAPKLPEMRLRAAGVVPQWCCCWVYRGHCRP